jgi:membrane protease YdiL (CAAX protease family)
MLPLTIATGVLFAIILLSNLAETRPAYSRLVWWFWGSVICLVGLLGVGFLVAPGPLPVSEDAKVPSEVAFVLLGASLLAGLSLLPVIRRGLARVMHLRPDSPVHLTALILSCYLVAWTLANLFWVGGVDGMQDTAEPVPMEFIVLQAAGLLAVAFTGVGLLTRRSWKQARERLGLDLFPGRSWVIAATAVVGLLGINFAGTIMWVIVAPEQAESIGHIQDILLGHYDSLGAVFLLSVLSSVSEEILFRGALQPVLGIVPTAILFGATHLQYAISPATLIILTIGVILGVLRRRFGTWTAVLAHFGYNFSLFLMGLIASRLLELTG